MGKEGSKGELNMMIAYVGPAVRSTLVVALIALSCARAARAHEAGAPFSGAIIDPLELHHAHIEDEQRLNFTTARAGTGEEGTRRVSAGSLELAAAWDEHFRWGSEAFIPFSDAGSGGASGIGDIDLRPLKHAFINERETVLSGVLGFLLPTGDESRGLGGGATVVQPYLFLDRAYGNWFLGINAAAGVSLRDARDSDLDYGAVLSYSFIEGTGRVAASRPAQRLVPALSLEYTAITELRGERKTAGRLLPGLNLWHTATGWTLRVGASIPLTRERESGLAYMAQIGNHFNWGSLLGRKGRS